MRRSKAGAGRRGGVRPRGHERAAGPAGRLRRRHGLHAAPLRPVPGPDRGRRYRRGLRCRGSLGAPWVKKKTFGKETFRIKAFVNSLEYLLMLTWKIGLGKSFYVEPSGIVGFYTGNDDFGIVAAPALTFGYKF